MRRRTALALCTAIVLSTTTGCVSVAGLGSTPPTELPTPEATEAIELVGLPVPEYELSATDDVHLSDVDAWSLRIAFSAPPDGVNAWLTEAFGDSEGPLVNVDGESPTQRVRPEDAVKGSRCFIGSNPKDPSATYAVLVHPEGRDVIIAAALTVR